MAVRNVGILVEGSRVITKLYLPDGGMKKMVIFCHGFPGTNRLPELAPILVELGIGLAEVGYRGDDGSQGNFSFLETPFDIWRAYKWLDHSFSTVPKVLLGYSAGGFYAQVFMTRWHYRPEKIVLLNSVVYTGILSHIGEQLWTEAGQILSLNDTDFYRQELAKLEEIKDMLKTIFSSINIPVTMVHSENDEVIPYGSARQFFGETRCTRNFITIPGKGHHLTGSEPELLNTLI